MSILIFLAYEGCDIYIYGRNQQNNMNFVLFFWVLLWHFLPPNPSCDNYCGVCGELSSWNSKQSADLTKSLRETKTKLNQSKQK